MLGPKFCRLKVLWAKREKPRVGFELAVVDFALTATSVT
jgi:hypothetical protein